MKQILVPTDFSTCANNAIDFAVRSAKLFPVGITLLHIFEQKGSVYSDYMGVNKEFNQALLNDARNKLAELKKAIEETEEVTVNTHVAVTSVVDAVLQATEELNIDLVVMGTLGAGAIKEKLWGSKTAALIGKTKVPVMVIPFFYTWKKPENILLSTNHFETEPAILDFLFEMADLYMAQVHVAVMTDEDDDKAAIFLEHTRKTPQYEKMLKAQYKEETLTATHLYGKEFEETLQKHIDDREIDILAMVTYQRGFGDRIFNPSKTKRMSYHTKIPLLVIPGKQENIF
ncbi:universal stress protein [Agriterribacter sp.]|uniref:universal stress protein n=1 Tax=Agriterribacter sp. TaxID=2821509 RepID=UPI002BA9F1B0|nr:universal stress protein [Agriterribacter sp.]HTN06836.1 universal stress protein [Agriterribacter sp.]